MSPRGTSVRLLLQTACKQELQKGTAEEHFCVLGLVPFVEINECTANSAERPHKLQVVITTPRDQCINAIVRVCCIRRMRILFNQRAI